MVAAFWILLLFCSPITAFEDSVTSEPRAKPRVAADSAPPRADLRVDVPLVLIPVNVTSPLGASVTGLNKENFRLFEDGIEQKIANFASEDGPVSIGLLLDASGSMANKIEKSREAARELFKTANPDDEIILSTITKPPKLHVPFSPDTSAL